MKKTVTLATLLVLLLPIRGLADTTLHDRAVKLFQSLTPDQRKDALLPFDSPERSKEVFTPGKRAGIQIKDLAPAQRDLAVELLTAFTSDYGKKKALAVAEQETEGLGHYYLCFFGEPGKDKLYAWRIAEHHLTIVQIEVEGSEPTVFGPILLGADPPVLWNDEEDQMIALYGAMTAAERAKFEHPDKGASSKELDGGSIQVSDLNQSAQTQVKEVFDGRLKFFAAPIAARIKSMVEKQGGLGAMRIAFYGGAATKRCADGGKWDFKLAGPGFLCDYENTRGHIHLSMKGQIKETK